jgi:dTDP-glucose pyrophosphorylase
MNKKNNLSAIIPASGKPTNKILPNSGLSDIMIPINGKPVIGYIVDDLLARGITDIRIVLRPDDLAAEKYLKNKFLNKCDLAVIKNDHPEKGVGYSVYLGAKKPAASYLVILGDTIYKGKLNFAKDFLVVSKNFEESNKWCFVENDKDSLKFINKPQTYQGNGKILCGIYFFKNGKNFSDICRKKSENSAAAEMKDLLAEYFLSNRAELIDEKGWYDCGNIENYYKAKKDFIKVRSFNSVKCDDFYGTITKRSKKTEKIKKEINWYLNLPDLVKIFSPRLVDYKITGKSAGYTMEFYGYQSLADLFVFAQLDEKIWSIIINRLFEIIFLFRKYRAKLPYKNYEKMYSEKIFARIADLEKNKFWHRLLDQRDLIINGKKYKNIKYFLEKLNSKIGWLYEEKEMSMIHGDLCLSNILFDLGGKIFKLIDPRGDFGETGIYGDIKYDLAKLRHSFVGNYDFITTDLFRVSGAGQKFELDFFNEEYHQGIGEIFDKILSKNNYDLKKVKYIEAWLFISMVPLHSDNHDRQLAMYLNGIRKLNEVNI